MGLLQIKVDLLEDRQKNHQAADSIAVIDQMLASNNEAIDTSRGGLDPLIPIVHLIKTYFDLDEMDSLAFESGIQVEEVPGETLSERARELVEYADRHGVLVDLLRTCVVKRPFVAWPEG